VAAPAVPPPSAFEEAPSTRLSGDQRLLSCDIEAAVSALLAGHHSAARSLLDSSSTVPAPVHVDLRVVLPAAAADGADGHDIPYVEVAFEVASESRQFQSEWPWDVQPPSNIFTSDFDTGLHVSRAPESRSRMDSAGSGTMPVVSLRSTPS
jgi:uncharacterized membrane-anchored protein